MDFGSFSKKDHDLPDRLSSNRHSKVLIIGIDGADPRLIERMMSEGMLPNFKRLADAGNFTRIASSNPPQSPVAWASIATGMNPGKHGVFDFIMRAKGSYLPMLALSKQESGVFSTKYTPSVYGKSFWRIASDEGMNSIIVRWPMTFPPVEFDGQLLAGLGVPDVKGLLNSYSLYATAADPVSITDELKGKLVIVEESNGVIQTQLRGPRTRKGDDVVDITVPMTIRKSATGVSAEVGGKSYDVAQMQWSDWVAVEFKINFMTKVKGICKFYLQSTSPFRMYVTSVELDPTSPLVDISYPKEFAGELADRIGLYHTLGLPEDTNALNDGATDDKIFLEQAEQIDAERTKMFWDGFERFLVEDVGIFSVVYDGSDRIQHMFWDEKIIDSGMVAKMPAPILDYYIKKDKFLGEVLSRIDNKTAVIVLSDHGFTSFDRAVSINTWLYENGYLSLTKPITELGGGDDGELFKYVDWKKTKAYSLGFTSIFINEAGRERNGVVDTSSKKELMNDIKSKLLTLKDPIGGAFAIRSVYLSSDVYAGDRIVDGPDLVVGFAKGFRMSWQNAVGGFTRDVFTDNTKHWKSDHLVDVGLVPGMIFTNFPLTKSEPSVLDIAPTVLSVIGINDTAFDGTSLYTQKS